jgi:hypothetical protein
MGPDPTPLDPKRPSGEIAMFKFILTAVLIALLAACSSIDMSGGYATSGDYWATANPPRSPGEGPSFHPVYP